ncbi:T9SS type A sorting domain-containing protein [bacterium]|nr:T9SS type A sorting domain-containing protein [bacterium]
MKIIKKLALFILFFGLLVLFGTAWSITYLTLDGSTELTVTPSAVLLIEGDFHSEGGELEFHVFEDINGDGILDPGDERIDYFKIMDGIPSLGFLEEDVYIRGDDDSTENALFRCNENITLKDFNCLKDTLCLFLYAKDEDESFSTATILINLEPGDIPRETPYIYGVISDSATGSGIEGLEVNFICSSGEVATVTDPAGRFWAPVEAGQMYLAQVYDNSGRYPWFDSAFIETGSGDDSLEFNVQLSAFDHFIHGIAALLDGGPVEGITVFADNTDLVQYSLVSSDSSGYYMLGVNPGFINLTAQADPTMHGYYVSTSVTRGILPDSTYTEVNFTLEPLICFIEGSVTFEDGAPAGGIMVLARRTGYNYFSNTNSDGNYIIAVSPETYRVFVNLEGYSADPEEHIIPVAESETVSDIDFVFTPDYTIPFLSGAVKDSRDRPIESILVIAYSPDRATMDSWLTTFTNSLGYYEFPEIPPGTWYVSAYNYYFNAPEPRVINIDLAVSDYITGQDFTLFHTNIDESVIPAIISLKEPYPNPFNGICNIEVPAGSALQVIDISGRLVYEWNASAKHNIISAEEQGGSYIFRWQPDELPTGIYLVNVNCNKENRVFKILYIK